MPYTHLSRRGHSGRTVLTGSNLTTALSLGQMQAIAFNEQRERDREKEKIRNKLEEVKEKKAHLSRLLESTVYLEKKLDVANERIRISYEAIASKKSSFDATSCEFNEIMERRFRFIIKNLLIESPRTGLAIKILVDEIEWNYIRHLLCKPCSNPIITQPDSEIPKMAATIGKALLNDLTYLAALDILVMKQQLIDVPEKIKIILKYIENETEN